MIRLLVLTLVISVVFVGWLWAADTPTSRSASTQPAAKQILQKLWEQSPPVTPATELTPPKGSKSGSGQAAGPAGIRSGLGRGQKLLPEGHYIRDRRGRLVRQTNHWLFTFESDGKALADPPIILLPNGWLEKIEKDVTSDTESIIFRVSGEVTAYRGKNYLLLRRVVLETFDRRRGK